MCCISEDRGRCEVLAAKPQRWECVACRRRHTNAHSCAVRRAPAERLCCVCVCVRVRVRVRACVCVCARAHHHIAGQSCVVQARGHNTMCPAAVLARRNSRHSNIHGGGNRAVVVAVGVWVGGGRERRARRGLRHEGAECQHEH